MYALQGPVDMEDVKGATIVLQICATHIASTYVWMADVSRTESGPPSQNVEV